MALKSLGLLNQLDSDGTFMRTTSCAHFGRDLLPFGHGIYSYRRRPADTHPLKTRTFALIQVAFNKAASTNAMLADVLSAPGAAGSPSTGACYQHFPDFRMNSFSTRRVISRIGKVLSRDSSGVGAQ